MNEDLFHLDYNVWTMTIWGLSDDELAGLKRYLEENNIADYEEEDGN